MPIKWLAGTQSSARLEVFTDLLATASLGPVVSKSALSINWEKAFTLTQPGCYGAVAVVNFPLFRYLIIATFSFNHFTALKVLWSLS